jgi:hypothetical protein
MDYQGISSDEIAILSEHLPGETKENCEKFKFNIFGIRA